MLEKNIQKKILQYLKSIGAYAVKTMITSKNGVPDVLVCYQSKFIGFEIKQPNEKATVLQDYNLSLIQKAGGLGFVVRDVEEVKLILANIVI